MSSGRKDEFDFAGSKPFLFDPILSSTSAVGVAKAHQGLPPGNHPASDSKIRKSLIWKLTGTSLIFLTPLITYWPTIFHYYGLRDSYSNLRESHEEQGKLIQFCASHARPIYGWLLEVTLRRIDTIHQLQWIRLLSALLLGAVSLATYRLVRRIGWSASCGLLLALWLSLLPSAQVVAGWAIGWPYSVAVLTALAAFFFAERALRPEQSIPQGIGAVVLVATSALIYQPNALFYAVPVAAALVARRTSRPRDDVHWVLCHVVVLTAGLLVAYCTIQACYLAGVFHRSARVAFETHWLEKFAWFLKAPLPNALSQFVINDDHGRERPAYLAGAALSGLILFSGAALEARSRGWKHGLIWLTGLFCLPILAFAISLLAAERYSTYRTIFSLTCVLLCFLLASLRLMLARVGSRTKRIAAAAVIATALIVARRRAFALLAVPQGNEWRLFLEGAKKVNLASARPSIFAIEPTPEDISTTTIYHDEFGSLSSNSDWVPKEMFKRALHDLHPEMPNLDQRYCFASGPRLPSGRFDVVIDLRTLRNLRTND